MKKLIATALIATALLTMSGCNKALIDTHYAFDYAYVSFPDGRSEKLKIKSWSDYEGEQIQITTNDGLTYLFHAENIVLVSEGKK
jgi:hypothetical protein